MQYYENRLCEFRIAELMAFDALVNGAGTEADRQLLIDMARIAEAMGADAGLCAPVRAALQGGRLAEDYIALIRELIRLHDQQRDAATPQQYITAVESITR